MQILLPNPPPMSCVTKRSLSVPTRIAGAIMIAAKPGNWLLQCNVHWPIPWSYSTTAALVSSGVDEKRSKCRRSIRTTSSASARAASYSPQSNEPDQTTFVPASSCRIGWSASSARSASTTASIGSYSTSTRSAASRASWRVAATTATTGSPWYRARPTARA